jgi:hypothetical protein
MEHIIHFISLTLSALSAGNLNLNGSSILDKASYSPIQPSPVTSCEAMGWTWRFENKVCVLREWRGCGPSGTFYLSQQTCLTANKISADLRYFPADTCAKFTLPGNKGLGADSACPADVAPGSVCTGNGGPGCSGQECNTQEPLACTKNSTVLACRPVDFICE